MKIEIGETALVTTNDWFLAPNGTEYKAVFGTVTAIGSAVDVLGVETNDWYLDIGDMIIAGCQINCLIRTDQYDDGHTSSWSNDRDGNAKVSAVPCKIYKAD